MADFSIEILTNDLTACFKDVYKRQPESRIQFEHPWPRSMVTKAGHNSAFYLTNAMELLDEPGEWSHDIESRQIYYSPRKGEKISKAVAVSYTHLNRVYRNAWWGISSN